MRTLFYLTSAALVFLLNGCVNDKKELRGSTADTSHRAVSTDKPTAAATVEIPGLDAIKANNTIDLTANDRMQFSDTLFKVNASQKVTLTLRNAGNIPKESMGHNFALLDLGTDFVTFATEAMKARDNEYIPVAMEKSVIAHTRLIGPGETDRISFTLPNTGIYDFLCTFPGHYGTMRGKIVAE